MAPLITMAIADDDADMRRIMRQIVERAGGFSIVGEAQSGPELLALVESARPQVVILDVEMPGKTGVECARVIQDTDPFTIIIFATAHEQYMADAFSVYAFDYLLKPFKLERAEQTLQRVREVLGHRAQEVPAQEAPAQAAPKPPRAFVPEQQTVTGRLMLRHREGVQFLDMEDILLVQREDRATVLYATGDKRYVTSDAMSEMETRLDPALFFRCHKSYIINLQHIDNITPYGRWTYVARLRGTQHDALITHEKYEELERRFS